MGMPVLFIRYNPDRYIDHKKVMHENDPSKRHEVLLNWLKYIHDKTPKKDEEFCRVMYLFYDGYKPNVSFEKMIANICVE